MKDNIIVTIPHTDPEYQSRSVTVYTEIMMFEQTSIEHLDLCLSILNKGREIKPYNEPLPSYNRSCDVTLPLC